MKILYVTTLGTSMSFFCSLIKELIDEGNTVDLACNSIVSNVPEYYLELGCKIINLPCTRSPLSKDNISAYWQLKKFISENHYDIVHCHTPIAGAITRLACRKFRKNGLRVFYTAHGFHFYKGASLKNWLLYYPIEKFCSRFTDTLITINHEDYDRARRHLHARRTEFVPGVGLDIGRFAGAAADRAGIRRELGVPEDAFLLISVGEVNRNKNHEIVIRALARIARPEIHYVIVGKGPLVPKLQELAVALGVGANVHFAGHRDDVPELLKAADVDVFPSIREGFGLAAVEGMAVGLPLICADNRGTRMYATEYDRADFHGMCSDLEMYACAITRLADDRQLYQELSALGPPIAAQFSVQRINRIMIDRIYEIKE